MKRRRFNADVVQKCNQDLYAVRESICMDGRGVQTIKKAGR